MTTAEALDFALDTLRAQAPELARLRLEDAKLIDAFRTSSVGQGISFPEADPALTVQGFKKKVGRAAHLAGKRVRWPVNGVLLAKIVGEIKPAADPYGGALEALQTLRESLAPEGVR